MSSMVESIPDPMEFSVVPGVCWTWQCWDYDTHCCWFA